MKKILIIILVLIFTNTQNQAKEIDDVFDISADYLEDISIIQFIEDQCDLRAQGDNFNSSKLSQCYYDSIKAYQKEVGKHLNNLKRMLSKDSYNQLIKVQKQWIQYSKTYDRLLDTTLHKQNKSSYGKYATADRTKKYKNMAENLSYLDYLIKQTGSKND